jgi:pyruvate/2-oxoglutarate/acetoin dehydrogenase E1 component
MSTVAPPTEVSFAEAIQEALDDAMAVDERIVLLGQDIAVGFPFGVTRNLLERYGQERVRDTPISEAATMGCGVGAAVAGLRPVVEVDFSGFLLLGFDQLINNAAKLRYMSGGQVRVPLVVRVGQGPLGGFAAQHSMALHGWLANVPGLAVCAPSSSQDAYELMRWSLQQTDPVVFCEDMRLYRSKSPLDTTRKSFEPQRARFARRGADVTILTFGYGVRLALSAAADLAEEGIDVEVVDLRFLSPLDEAAIAESAERTGRVLCLSDDPLLGGFTATLAAVADEVAHVHLRAPILRLGARHTPAPYNEALERVVYPTAEAVAVALRALATSKAS